MGRTRALGCEIHPPPGGRLLHANGINGRASLEFVAGGGVKAGFAPVDPPHVPVYDPDDRFANAEGLMARPIMDYAQEFVNMSQAEHAYKANAATISTENEMIGALLNEVS